MFTNDDLKRLKEFIKVTRLKYAVQLAMNDHKLYDEIEAFIARLEAAEAIFETDPEDEEAQHKAYEAWRKAAEK